MLSRTQETALSAQDELTGESPYLGVLNAREDNWEAVAHAFFTKHKLESPWEKVC